jgi:hypothetical protein
MKSCKTQLLTLFSYREATISCSILGNTEMALLWAQKAADISIAFGDQGMCMYTLHDARIVTQLRAAVRRNHPFQFEHIRWPGPGDLASWQGFVMSNMYNGSN